MATRVDAKEFFFSHTYQGGVIIQGGGVMFRRELLKYIDFDEILRRKLPVEDFPMQAIWAQHTKFWRLEDPIVVYRIYKESATFMPLDNPKYLSYQKGLVATRRYLNELFPDDACFSEAELQEQLFYKEFLLYVHQKKYLEAKRLVFTVPEEISQSVKVVHARRIVHNRIIFYLFRIYKEYIYWKDLNSRV